MRHLLIAAAADAVTASAYTDCYTLIRYTRAAAHCHCSINHTIVFYYLLCMIVLCLCCLSGVIKNNNNCSSKLHE